MKRIAQLVIGVLKIAMAVPFLLMALPLALLARILPGKKTVDRTPEQVAELISNFIDGTGRDWDWDEFESLEITDPDLNALRLEAIMAGPPYRNEEEQEKHEQELRSVIARVRKLTSA